VLDCPHVEEALQTALHRGLEHWSTTWKEKGHHEDINSAQNRKRRRRSIDGQGEKQISIKRANEMEDSVWMLKR